MATPVYSTRFAFIWGSGTLSFDYVVPDGYLAVVRDLSGVILPGSTEYGVMEALGPGEQHIAYWETPLGHNRSVHWEGRVVLYAGEHLELNSYNTAPHYDLTASGYLLSLP